MRNFGGVPVRPFLSKLNVAAVKLQGIQTQVVPINIDWRDYGASSLLSNIAVEINIEQQSFVALDFIRSVYIDNLGSNQPIFVVFPDTTYTIVAKPNSEGWYPAYTNGKKLTIVGLGFTDVSIPTSEILISNAILPPGVNNEIDTSVAYWLASSSITRGTTIYNQNLGTPALGDQFTSQTLDLSVDGFTVNCFGTPFPGFIYITDMYIGISSYTGGVNPCANNIFFESLGVAGQFYSGGMSVPGGNATIPLAPLLQMQGQWKIDASQFWRVRNGIINGAPVGTATFNFSYTSNPT